ncbi:ComF family protein [Nitrosovibrio sp. Nv6]|uniref:ComF family protein n=1 Tax=Nitrosovibrio sp. Nv6 TaxID=1855340 RepID=UPI0008AE30A3|nr:ComF family protein [Nitrosovibrio sp. Nv6]SEO36021.1 comF family protein [Nitrosovibrio sp. Nv6]
MNSRLNIKQVLFSKNCLLCGAAADGNFCSPCEDSLPHLPPHYCPVCALPTAESRVCGACLANPPAFDLGLAAVNYAFPVDALLHSLKYQKNLAMAPVLADLLVRRIDAGALPDFIVPMPLHPARLRERGFNQALEIARRVSKRFGIPLLPAICRRVKDTPSQTGLPWKERGKNIRDAFACETDLSGKRIAMLDDVMTTGSTLNELAKILRKCGAAHISGWVVARTLSGDS